MRKVFIDTNVLIDFLGERDPFYTAAARIVSCSDRKEIELMVSSLSYATASYILMRYNPRDLVLEKAEKIHSVMYGDQCRGGRSDPLPVFCFPRF